VIKIKLENLAYVIPIIIMALIIFAFAGPFVIVGAGERGVVTRLGAVQDKIFGEGLHFKTPLIEAVHIIDVKTQKYETDASAASKDLQIVTSQIAVNYRLDPTMVNWLYQNVGSKYRQILIEPAVQEAVKSATSKYTAEELITQRSKVRDDMVYRFRDKMGELSHNSIIVDDFNIIDFDFSEEFNDAIEKKVTAEQKALEAQQDLERIKFEAQQQIEIGKAEAEILKLQKLEITPELIELRKVERDREAIAKWDGILPQWTCGGGMPFINMETMIE